VINEIVNEYTSKKKNSSVYICFIDIEKAFDRVNRDKLWQRMRRIGVDDRLRETIMKFYNKNKIKLTMNGIESDWIENNVGVRQGCTMSPVIFNIFLEELLMRLRNIDGIEVGDRNLSCLAFADDIMLVSETAEGLQRLLAETGRFGNDLGVKFSGSKCKVMIFGEGANEGWVLGNDVLEVVNEYRYLGVLLSNGSDILAKHKREKELGMLRMVGMMKMVASKNANAYMLIRELWKGVAVPQSLYGYEICKVTKKECEWMDRVQNRVGRIGLGANSFVAVEAIQGEMGWSRYSHRIHRMKANFKARLLNMEDSVWVRYMYDTFTRSIWRKNLLKIDRLYDLQETYTDGNSKIAIRNKIRERAQLEWEAGVGRKVTLGLYRNKERPKMEEFYDGRWSSMLLFKARTGSLEVNARTYRWNGIGDECGWCNRGEKETVCHMMVECMGHEMERRLYLDTLKHVMGEILLQSVLERDDFGLGVLLGFESECVNLKCMRNDIVIRTKVFLMALWRKRV
jgi:hypothetical protein